MTIKEAILQSLNDLKTVSNYMEIYQHMTKNSYYDFKTAKTPASTVSALLGDFMKSELNTNQTFTEYFAVLTKVN